MIDQICMPMYVRPFCGFNYTANQQNPFTVGKPGKVFVLSRGSDLAWVMRTIASAVGFRPLCVCVCVCQRLGSSR